MAEKIRRVEKKFFVDDGKKRGPMTMLRVRFHPRERKLIAVCADRRVAWFDLEAEANQDVKGQGKCVLGELVCPLEIGWIRSVDLHPRGHQLVTGGSDRTLRLWDWKNSRPTENAIAKVDAHTGWVESVSYSPDGRSIATAGFDGLVKIWNSSDLKLLHELKGHEGYIDDVIFSHDGRWLISGCEKGRVLIWGTSTWHLARTIDFGDANDQTGQTPKHSGVHRLSISHDDRWLGVAGGTAISIFDFATGEIVARDDKTDMQIAFHPKEDVLAAGESDVKFWNVDADRFTPPENDNNGKPKKPQPIPRKPFASVKRGEWSLGLGFSRDGQSIALGKANGTVEVYDVV